MGLDRGPAYQNPGSITKSDVLLFGEDIRILNILSGGTARYDVF